MSIQEIQYAMLDAGNEPFGGDAALYWRLSRGLLGTHDRIRFYAEIRQPRCDCSVPMPDDIVQGIVLLPEVRR